MRDLNLKKQNKTKRQQKTLKKKNPKPKTKKRPSTLPPISSFKSPNKTVINFS